MHRSLASSWRSCVQPVGYTFHNIMCIPFPTAPTRSLPCPGWLSHALSCMSISEMMIPAACFTTSGRTSCLDRAHQHLPVPCANPFSSTSTNRYRCQAKVDQALAPVSEPVMTRTHTHRHPKAPRASALNWAPPQRKPGVVLSIVSGERHFDARQRGRSKTRPTELQPRSEPSGSVFNKPAYHTSGSNHSRIKL